LDRSTASLGSHRVDEGEFLATVSMMRPALWAVALRIVGNEEDAADVVQDASLRAWRALPGFRGESKLSTWLHAIVVNVALTLLQQRRQHPIGHLSELDQANLAEPRDQADPQAAAELGALHCELLQAVKDLPLPLGEVVVARELRGLTHSQIAAELHISEAASRVRLHRARRQLRLVLADHQQADGVGLLGA
jgi:RNA polymerase sigma-70 factor (ECF subfamily)